MHGITRPWSAHVIPPEGPTGPRYSVSWVTREVSNSGQDVDTELAQDVEDIAPMGKRGEIRHVDFCEVQDGKIVENWVIVDFRTS